MRENLIVHDGGVLKEDNVLDCHHGDIREHSPSEGVGECGNTVSQDEPDRFRLFFEDLNLHDAHDLLFDYSWLLLVGLQSRLSGRL